MEVLSSSFTFVFDEEWVADGTFDQNVWQIFTSVGSHPKQDRRVLGRLFVLASRASRRQMSVQVHCVGGHNVDLKFKQEKLHVSNNGLQ